MGISAQELRIGNYVLDETGIITIIVAIDSERKFWNDTLQKEYKGTARLIMLDNFDWNTSYGCWVEKLKPIPLTEEWFLNFGFDKEDNDIFDDWFDFTKGKVIIYFDSSKCEFTHLGTSIRINYVHQLQNLIFSLTGIDLKLKSE